MKKAILEYLKKYFSYWQDKTGNLPRVPFDKELNTRLYVGNVDESGYIQWTYQENRNKIDFENLDKEGKLRKEIKEYFGSYQFLELAGFLDGKLVCFEAIDDVEDVIKKVDLEKWKKYLKEVEKSVDIRDWKALENCIEIGSYEGILELYFDNDTGNIVAYDFDWHKKIVIANTFQELFEKLTPNKK